MYNKFESNQICSMDENSYVDKTPEQIFLEKRAELFLKGTKKYPQWFRYGLRRFNPKFKYIRNNFNQNT